MTTIVTRAGKGSPLTNNEMDANLNNLNTYKVETSTAATTYTTKVNPATSGTLTHSGNIVLSGTGKCITGDFSNATVTNRVMWQTSTVNGGTTFTTIPNGTGTFSNIVACASSDPGNSTYGALSVGAADVRIDSGRLGTGVYKPIAFFTSGVERYQFGLSGQLGIGGANYGTAGQVLTSSGPDAAPSWGTASGFAAGAVSYFATAVAPSGWLKANGALISRTAYATLFAAIGTTFGAGDGSTTFQLPDLRGEFVRGWDDARGIDAGRGIGTWQASDNKSHTHNFRGGNAANGGTRYNASYGGGGSGYTIEATGSIVSEGGVEARPRNIALLACIKF